ncbi:hypothetical protein [Chitinophaga sancti]|uniref:hypothetical protein n=1 Tax=Chitinophaga sancti TaxID=1004 RepID=UPI003F7AED0B
MANWAFEIDIADNFIVGLTETLTDKGFRIWCFYNDGQPLYVFSSAYLASTADSQVYEQARYLVKFIDGVSYLLFENKDKVNKISFTSVIDVNTFRMVNVERSVKAHVDIDFSAYRSPIEEDEHPAAHLLKLVPGDVFIKELLLALSEGMDVKSLRKAYDHVLAFLMEKGDELILSGFSEATLARFTQAMDAHQRRIRHEEIQDMMSLKDAQELVAELVMVVLARYYRINLKPFIIKDGNAQQDDWYDSLYD